MTDAYLRAIKPAASRVEYWDSKTRGLCLRVTPAGVRTWSLRYVPKGSTDYRRLTLGEYPTVSLSVARERAMEARLGVSGGADPQGERMASREESARSMPFSALADAYLERYAKANKRSWRYDEMLLKAHVLPKWANLRADRLTRADAAALLDEVATRSPSSANRTQTILAKLFNWAVDGGMLAANPIAQMRKRGGKEKAKERVLSPAEIPVVWRAVEGGNIAPAVTAALRIILLTGARPGEISGVALDELKDIHSPERARIEIPGDRMKGGKPHIVPLPPRALQIVREQLDRLTVGATHLFASEYLDRTSIARHSLSQAIGRIIAVMDGEAAETKSLKKVPPTPHDLRRTLSTGLSALGVQREVRQAILAHVPADVMGVHYDKYDRLAEKRAALELWDEHLSALLAPAAGGPDHGGRGRE